MYKLEEKIKIINFFNKHGLEITLDAFNVKKSSIYRWKKQLTESYNNWNVLKNKSTNRIKRNQRIWDYRILDFIISLRKRYYRLSKEKIQVLLKKECNSLGIKTPSVSTVGRLLSDLKVGGLIPRENNVSFYAATSRFHIKKKRKKKKNRPKKIEIKTPGKRLQIDTVIVYIHGVKRYLLSVVDIFSRITFSYGYTTLSSAIAKDFFQKAQKAIPFITKNSQIQNDETNTKSVAIFTEGDNGSEFMKSFEDYLLKQEITQVWNYPRTPKMNAFIERYNRTVQEEFVYSHIRLFKEDIEEFNIELMEYLIWYNTERPHFSLDLKSPIDYLLIKNEFSKMWWTETKS
jgi:putative transposase